MAKESDIDERAPLPIKVAWDDFMRKVLGFVDQRISQRLSESPEGVHTMRTTWRPGAQKESYFLFIIGLLAAFAETMFLREVLFVGAPAFNTELSIAGATINFGHFVFGGIAFALYLLKTAMANRRPTGVAWLLWWLLDGLASLAPAVVIAAAAVKWLGVPASYLPEPQSLTQQLSEIALWFGLFACLDVLWNQLPGWIRGRPQPVEVADYDESYTAARSWHAPSAVSEARVLRMVGSGRDNWRLDIGDQVELQIPDGHNLLVTRIGDNTYRTDPVPKPARAAA